MTTLLQALEKSEFRKEVLLESLLLKDKDQSALFRMARQKRTEHFPSGKVEVRSVIEISNICSQECNFCGIHSCSKKQKYTLARDQFMDIAGHIYSKGRRIFLLQSGENRSQGYVDLVSGYVSELKSSFNDIVLILCIGNLDRKQYKQLKDAGADRYILKFETSNPDLYRKIKPSDTLKFRVECIENLIDLGFDVGSGNITGLPGQSLVDLADDLLFISKFDLSMASSAVFVPNEDSKYRDKPAGDLDMTLNFMALMRIMYPHLLIPSTSSLENIRKGGQYLGLMAGANSVTVHDGTPSDLKKLFPIYSIGRFLPEEKFLRDIVARAGLKCSEK